MNKTNQSERGTIIRLQHSFGFIEHPDYPSNLFFHASQCENFNSLKMNNEVTFEIAQNKKGEPIAANVRKKEN